MSYNLTQLKILDISLNKILIFINIAIPDLQKSDLEISLNNNIFTNYELQYIDNSSEKVYAIIPNTPFSPYDSLSLEIIKNNYASDKIKIFFSENFYNHNCNINYKISSNAYGNYKIVIPSINDTHFNLESKEITISPPINTTLSEGTVIGDGNYAINENIPIKIELFTINNTHVPNGNYLIATNIKPSN
ncbi:hypothetical protein Z968_12460 [Clostridium novyi A str. 4552]|uniref:Uncharacterized protein n=1 Tax=Clostridium novyi A str. 4552 TaxID=1444289 RepID=A0A0A0I1Z1_CLONO|nr:hypothetical protein [Clostridium novyi]KGM93675.1 hypothetical protein Z968_12460 [Clostridium novyi A str. 4552]